MFINTFGNRKVVAEVNQSNYLDVVINEEKENTLFVRKISGMGYNEFMNFSLNKEGRKEFKKYLSNKGLEPSDISMSSDKTSNKLFVDTPNGLVEIPELKH
jgi:hypothetical protein